MHNRKGFSLIELLVALSILAVVAAIVVPRFMNVRAQAATTVANTQRKIIQNAVQQFLALGGTIAATTTGPGAVLNFLNNYSAAGARTTALGVTDSVGNFSSSTVSLQLNPKSTAQAAAPASTVDSGFYWSAAVAGGAWYVDGNATVWRITMNMSNGITTFVGSVGGTATTLDS